MTSVVTPSDSAPVHRGGAKGRAVATLGADISRAWSRLSIATASSVGLHHRVNEDSMSPLDGIAPVYVVAEIDVTDPATYQTYVDRNGALVQSFGGRFLARGGKTEAIAGPPPRGRVAIYTFESMEKMQAWRDSAQYKELTAIRDQSSTFRSFAVEGLPQ